MKTNLKISILICILLTGSLTYAQEEEIEDPAEAAQNPLANVISMPFQNNTDFVVRDSYE